MKGTQTSGNAKIYMLSNLKFRISLPGKNHQPPE